MRQYLENGMRYLLLMTNSKLHMRFRLAPRTMTLLLCMILTCHKFELSGNFTWFRRFGGNGYTNYDKPVLSATEL